MVSGLWYDAYVCSRLVTPTPDLFRVAAAFSGGLCAIEASQQLLHEIAKNPCTAELKNIKLDYFLSGAGFHRYPNAVWCLKFHMETKRINFLGKQLCQ